MAKVSGLNGPPISPATLGGMIAPSVTAVRLALELFSETTGVETGLESISEAVLAAERDAAHSPSAWWGVCLTRAGSELGINIFRLRRSLRKALQSAGPSTPWITADAHGRLWAITGRKGGKVEVRTIEADIRSATLSLEEVRRLLGVSSDDHPVDWATAEPALPLSTVASDPHHGHHRSPFSRLNALLRTEERDVWIVVVYSIAIGLLSLAVPVAVQSLVNTVAFGAVLQPLVVLTIFVFAALVFSGLLTAMRFYVVELMQQRFFVKVASDVAHRLVRARADAFDRHHGPELVNRFFDVVTVQKSGAMLLLDGLSILMQTVIGMALLAIYHPWLLAFDVILLVCIIFVIFGLGRGAVKTSIEESRQKYAMAAWLEETARHFTSFKSDFGAQYATHRADNIARAYIDARRRHFRILVRQITGTLTLQALSSALLLGIGGWLVISRQLTLGQLVAAELIVTAVVGGFAKFGKQLEVFYDLMAATDKLGHLVDLPLERTGGMAPLFSRKPASIRFNQVSFGYPNSPHILGGATFEIPSGARYGLIGQRGSGKSAIVDLIYGLRQPQAGVMEFDGIDYRNLSLPDLRSQIALVREDGIFEGSIYENIRLGRPELRMDDIRQALSDVGLLEDVLALPRSLDTELTTGGLPLSPGQAARILLARAVVGKPRFLLLDDSIENVQDARDRAILVETLFSPDAPWTLLVVSESEAILQHCDRVITPSGGQLQDAPIVGQNGRVSS